jgi:Ca2+-binding EF-hand superfamily protein
VPWADFSSQPQTVPRGVVGALVDTNGDGFADAIGYDTNGDGFIDALDSNGDGQLDTALVMRSAKNASAGAPGSIATTAGLPVHTGLDDWGDNYGLGHASVTDLAGQIFSMIDADGDGNISKLELLAAMVRNHIVNDFILPDFNSSRALTEEKSFEAVSAIFDAIGCGEARISRDQFINYFCNLGSCFKDATENEETVRSVFELIDAEAKGTFSAFDLLGALQRYSAVTELLLPGVDRRTILRDETSFDAANALWDVMAGDKRRVCFADFVAYFKVKSRQQARPKSGRQPRKSPRFTKVGVDHNGEGDENDSSKVNLQNKDDILPRPTLLQSLRRSSNSLQKPFKPSASKLRHQKTVLIIYSGYDVDGSQMRSALVNQSGFRVQYVDVPKPDHAGFPMMTYLPTVKAALDRFRPDVLMAASMGSAYVVALWQMGWWSGPTLMINAHPSLNQLPKDAVVIISHGSNDEVYKRSRSELEKLLDTGSKNKCFLHYSANSGHFSGGFTRLGDQHDQASLLQFDCLPRLLDAATCGYAPDLHLVSSWRQQLSAQRNDAENWLSHCPEQLRTRWASVDHMGMDDKKLHEVPRGSDEFSKARSTFSWQCNNIW